MPEQEMGSGRLVPKGLPGARRGYDRDAVEALLREARRAWAALEEEHRRLLSEIDRAGGLDYLARDLGAVAGDVGRVLADAQEAARGLRERSQRDAAERLASAVVEARRMVAEAEGQAFHLRADAWAAAEALLRDADQAHREMIAAADAEVLVIRAEAEQEAHRLVAGARREATDITRGARFQAERAVMEARAQPERILPVEPEPIQPVEPPPAQPAAAKRRRRPAPAEPAGHGEEVIRVIQPPGMRRAVGGAIDPASYGDALAAEVEALRVNGGPPEAVPEASPAPASRREEPPPRVEPPAEVPVRPAPASVPADPEPVAAEVEWEEAAEVEAEPGQVPAAEPGEPAVKGPAEPAAAAPPSEAPEEPRAPGVVGELFARLRGRGAERPAPAAPPAEEAAAVPAAVVAQADALEVRERLLLPVQNRALRRVKEGIVELQNLALDALRVSGSWQGEVPAASALAGALDPVAEEGAEAGATAAGELLGTEAPAPVISARVGGLAGQMAGELAAQVQAAVAGSAGAGPLEVASAVARVFRAWRSDEAERWVRTVAYAAYHDSLAAGLAVSGVARVVPVAAGLLCAQCPALRGEPWDPAGRPPAGTLRPPAQPGCICTITVG